MGTISARECTRVLDLTETVAAIHLLASCQAVDLRGAKTCHPASVAVRDAVRQVAPMNDADRRMDVDSQAVLRMYRANELPIGDIAWTFDDARV